MSIDVIQIDPNLSGLSRNFLEHHHRDRSVFPSFIVFGCFEILDSGTGFTTGNGIGLGDD